MLTPEGTGSTVPAAQNPKFVSVIPAESNWRGTDRGGRCSRYNLQCCFSPWTLHSPRGTGKVNMMLIRTAKYSAAMWESVIWIGSSFHPLQKKHQPQIGISSTAISILVSCFFMLHIYSSIKYAVLLLPLSPTRQAAMSLPPSARKGRQVFAPHISTSHESHSNHDSVVFQQRTWAEGLTPLQKLYWESAASSEAPEQLVTRDALKPQSLWGGGYYSSAGNPTCRQAGQRWSLILPPFWSFVQFISTFNWARWKPGNAETGACLSFTDLMKFFSAACSPVSSHSNPLSLFCLTGARCFAHSPVLKYWACALLLLWMKGEQPRPSQSLP